MIGHYLALAVPAVGVFIVVLLQTGSSTKPGTSAKPEGDDHRQNGDI